MFYDLTKTSPPQKYIENEWWDMLEEKAPYFMRYVESEEKDNVNKISRNIEKDLNQIYKFYQRMSFTQSMSPGMMTTLIVLTEVIRFINNGEMTKNQ